MSLAIREFGVSLRLYHVNGVDRTDVECGKIRGIGEAKASVAITKCSGLMWQLFIELYSCNYFILLYINGVEHVCGLSGILLVL